MEVNGRNTFLKDIVLNLIFLVFKSIKKYNSVNFSHTLDGGKCEVMSVGFLV